MIKITKDKLLVTGQGAIQSGVNVTAATLDNMEALEKVLKITDRCIEISKLVTGTITKSLASLSEKCKSTVLVFDSIKVFSSLKTLCCPDKNGKYFLTNIENSLQKRIDRVCLFVHTCFKTVRGMAKIGLVSLGQFAKVTIGRLSVFDLLTDSFIALSSFFGAWDTLKHGLPQTRKNINVAKLKLQKWTTRQEDIRRLKAHDLTAIEAFSNKYIQAKEKIPGQIVKLNELKTEKLEELNQVQDEQKEKCLADLKKIDADITKLEKKLKRIEGRISMIKANDFASLANDLSNQKIEGYGGKIHKWTVIKHNQHISEKKHYLKMASTIGKIAIVSAALSLTGVYGGVWGFGTALTMLIFGNILDAIGLTKILYEQFAKIKPIPKPV